MNKNEFQAWAKRLASSVESLEMNLSHSIDAEKKENAELAGHFAFDPKLTLLVKDVSNSAIAYHRGRRDLAQYLRDRLERDGNNAKTK